MTTSRPHSKLHAVMVGCYEDSWVDSLWLTQQEAEEKANALRAADTAPVPHGYWVVQLDAPAGLFEQYERASRDQADLATELSIAREERDGLLEQLEAARERIENAAGILPDPMHPEFPRQFVDRQATGLAWLSDDIPLDHLRTSNPATGAEITSSPVPTASNDGTAGDGPEGNEGRPAPVPASRSNDG